MAKRKRLGYTRAKDRTVETYIAEYEETLSDMDLDPDYLTEEPHQHFDALKTVLDEWAYFAGGAFHSDTQIYEEPKKLAEVLDTLRQWFRESYDGVVRKYRSTAGDERGRDILGGDPEGFDPSAQWGHWLGEHGAPALLWRYGGDEYRAAERKRLAGQVVKNKHMIAKLEGMKKP